MKVIRNKSNVVAMCTLLSVLLGFAEVGQGQSRIVNFVSVGGSDVQDPDFPESGPGFDKNYSLTAFKYFDGSVRGTLIDRWSGGGLMGLNAEIDCLHVVGNQAWVSGVVTQGQTTDEDGNPINMAGYVVRTVVQDNGQNNDPANPDRIGISFTRPAVPFDCSLMRGSLFDMPGGQAIVR